MYSRVSLPRLAGRLTPRMERVVVATPAGSMACSRPWKPSLTASIPPPGSITRAERLASGSRISSPLIIRTPLGSLVVGEKKSPLIPATAPPSRRAPTAEVSSPRVTGEPPGSTGASDTRGASPARTTWITWPSACAARW